jgi:hypothetical protein
MIRLLSNGGSLSESDLSLLSGTTILLSMMRNRIVILKTKKTKIEWEELTKNVKGLYHVRSVDKDNTVYQVWFELKEDLNQFEKDVLMSKLSDDGFGK